MLLPFRWTCPLAAWIACSREWEGSGSRASASERRSKSSPRAREAVLSRPGGIFLGFAGSGLDVEARATIFDARARVADGGNVRLTC